MSTLFEIYESKVASGEIAHDAAQVAALGELERIRQEVERPVKRGFFGKAKPVHIPGLYLWGGVGRGKSMIMDLFVEALTVPVRRVHFHEFMQEIHTGLHEARKNGAEDALRPVAQEVLKGLRVLAFDEMQIKDITDAMIVGRLFEMMFEAGIVVVTTSNRIPDDLYKDGLNRQLFLPFIELIKQRLHVWEMVSATDYRQNRLLGEQVYFAPITPENRTKIDVIWTDLSRGQCAAHTITVKAREIVLPKFSNGVARVRFFDLCGAALGPSDYLAIADAVRVLILEDIPQLGRSNFNEAKRFVTLIDALYEARVRLVALAAAKPEMLYLEGEGSFEFERTASRLMEMQSQDWAIDQAE